MEGYQFNSAFVANEVQDFRPIPEDRYVLRIAETRPKEVRDESGNLVKSSVQFVYEVVEGEYAGRLVFENFHFYGVKPGAIDRARNNLSRLMNAVGVKTMTNTNQLIGYEFEAHVVVRKGNEGFSDSNEISRRYARTVKEDEAPASTENSGLDWN